MATTALVCRARVRPGARSLALIAGLIVALVGAMVPGPAAADWAPPRTVYIPDTGHTSDGLFLAVWRDERALLGDPITEEFHSRTDFSSNGTSSHDQHIVQYYQNLALVYVPDAAAGEQVQALQLGRAALDDALKNRPSVALNLATRRTACPAGSADTCTGFAQTGHTLRGAFRDFWNDGDAGRWLGRPLSEAVRAADGSLIQYFEGGVLRQAAGGSVQVLPLGAATAKQLRLPTAPIERASDIPVYDEALFIPPPEPTPEPAADENDAGSDISGGWSLGTSGPGPQVGSGKEVVVSLSQQALWAYEDGQLVLSTYVSTGTGETEEVTTPTGQWSVLTKYDVQTMEGTISGEHYRVPDVPYVMYFDNRGDALHGTYWHNNFGHPMSHGCVNLPMDVAAWMYGWAPIGMPVTILP